MRWKKLLLGVLLLLVAAGTVDWLRLDKETRAFILTAPTGRNILFWSQAQRDAGFRALDRIPLLARSRVAQPGAAPRALPPGPPLKLALDVDAFMAGQRSAALLVLHRGRLRLERYGLGFDGSGRWTSFSVAKAFTSTLAGAALKDGAIRSMDDLLDAYIPEMRGSAYGGVTVRQLLTMTSGIAWNEDYDDPQSDVARFDSHRAPEGQDALVDYMRRLPRAAPAGARWHYNTGETNLVGILISRAVGKPLTEYLQEKIWQGAGMEYPATWILNKTGHEISGCCIQASPRDFARMGQFILEGAKVNGASILPDGWLAQATHRQADIGEPGKGYGYQWSTYDDGTFTVRGAFGQGLFIDPARELVIATNADWAGGALDPQAMAARDAFYEAVQQALDEEAKGG